MKFHSQNTFSRKKWKEPDGRFFLSEWYATFTHWSRWFLCFPLSLKGHQMHWLQYINQIDTINMFEYVENGQFYLVLFTLFVFVLRAHSIRSKYLIKIQYRLQNDRFVCTSVPVAGEWDQKPISVDCLRDFGVQTIFGAKLLLYSSMEFKVLVFFINWRCHLTIYEHCGRSIDWKPINVMPYIRATSIFNVPKWTQFTKQSCSYRSKKKQNTEKPKFKRRGKNHLAYH